MTIEEPTSKISICRKNPCLNPDLTQILQNVLVPALILVMIINTSAVLGQDTSRYSIKMAESVMQWRPSGYGGWDYVTGTVLRGFDELWRVTGDERYFDYLRRTVDNVIREDGSIQGYNKLDYNIDEIREGCQLLLLYKMTGEEKYRIATDLLREQLEEHPRTNSGGFWHKQRYPWQMWLDGLYMGSPFYAEYSRLFGFDRDLDDVVHQITEMDAHAYDTVAKLHYHGWDESGLQTWGDPETGTSASFWGRAIGWYAMAIVDVLDHLPPDHSGRDTVLNIFNRVAEGIALYRDPGTKVWWQVTDQIGRDSNYLESSSSCMFVYALAKGLRLGYLDASYREVIRSGYQGILENFIDPRPDGTIFLTQTCRTAGLGNGRDGTYAYYTMQTDVVSNDGKAIGPFITASIEVEMLDSIYPPGNLYADTLLFEGPVLSWFGNSTLENGFILERKQQADSTGYVLLADLPAGTTSYTDSTVEDFIQYSYHIRAYNDTLVSRNSNPCTLTTLYRNGQPLPAGKPVPEDASVMVAVDQELSWESGRFAASHDLYFGTDNPPPFTGNITETNWTPAPLERGVTYYWRVDEVNDSGTTAGEVWSFTADSTPPAGYFKTIYQGRPHLMIHPSPADSYIQVDLPEVNEAGSFVILDISGRMVRKIQLGRPDKKGVPLFIDTSRLAPGIYHLYITGRQGGSMAGSTACFLISR